MFHSDGTGGGLYVNTYSNNITFTITDTQIDNNSSYYGGGGISCPFGTLTISGGEISNNVTRGSGGGILGGYGTLTVVDTAITGNRVTALSSFLAGGGIYNMGTLNLTNVTIAGNQLVGAGSLGGGLYTIYGIATINNSIIAMNTAASFADIYQSSGTIQGSNNLSPFTGWKDPSGNYIYSKSLPLFVDAASGNYHLASDSQAIGMGAYPNVAVQPTSEIMALSAEISPLSLDVGTNESTESQPTSASVSPLPLVGEGPRVRTLSQAGEGRGEGNVSANLAVISSYFVSQSMSLDVYLWNQNEHAGWVDLAKPNNSHEEAMGIPADEYIQSLNPPYDLTSHQFLFGQAEITRVMPINGQGDDSEDQPVTNDWSGSDMSIFDSDQTAAIDHFFRDGYDSDLDLVW